MRKSLRKSVCRPQRVSSDSFLDSVSLWRSVRSRMDNGEAKRANHCVRNVQCEARRKPGGGGTAPGEQVQVGR